MWFEGLVSFPLEEKRLHKSEAGSAWGVLEAPANLLRATWGVVNLVAGDEAGEELFARLLPFLGIIGEAGSCKGTPDLQSTLSPGDFSPSSSSVMTSGTPNKSFHEWRSAGVLASLDGSSSLESGNGLFLGIDLVVLMFSFCSSLLAAFTGFAGFGGGLEDVSSDRKAWSLFLEDSETGASDCRGPLLGGLLLVLCHPPRCHCHVSKYLL